MDWGTCCRFCLCFHSVEELGGHLPASSCPQEPQSLSVQRCRKKKTSAKFIRKNQKGVTQQQSGESKTQKVTRLEQTSPDSRGPPQTLCRPDGSAPHLERFFLLAAESCFLCSRQIRRLTKRRVCCALNCAGANGVCFSSLQDMKAPDKCDSTMSS